QQMVFFVCVAGTVTAIGFFLSRLFVGGKDQRLRQRLVDGTDQDTIADQHAAARPDTMMPVLGSVVQAAAQPFMPSSREKQSSMRKQLNFAGIYSPSAPGFVTGAKVIFMVAGVGVGYFVG